MKRLRSRLARTATSGLIVVALLAVTCAVAWRPAARAAADVLVEEHPLRPAAAIVVLQGGLVFRDKEGAALYRAGWAPKVVISRDDPAEFIPAAHALGIAYPTNYEVSVQVLRASGVPDDAIVTMERTVRTTAEELAQVAAAFGPGESPLILVSSPIHTRRAGMLWRRIAGGQRPIVLRPSSYDPFDRDGWWRNRTQILALVREYLSLGNFVLGSPTR